MVVDDDRLAELNPKTRTCVVLGGRGFLGRSLVLRLLKLGKWMVRIADSAPSLQLDPSEHGSLLEDALSSGRATYHHVDVRDKSSVIKAVEGSSVVFYMGDADLPTDNFYLCYTIFVQGAKNVINACQECKVRRLIYNSSADVVCDGSRDIINGDESLPYPWKFGDVLSDLKAQAEALILFANNIDGLLTCAIRPCNAFGPGDAHFVPLLVNLAKSRWRKFILGSNESVSDFTYAENVSHAHICAEEALDFRMATVAGKAFFISNLDPMKFWVFVSLILEGLGYQRPLIKLPARMVGYLNLFLEWIHKQFGFTKCNHSLFHYIQLASHSKTFNCSAAQKHIGYSPVVPHEEGISLTNRSFSHLSNDMSFSKFIERDQSKVDKLLGGGKVADILLWRDEKKSFTCFLSLVLLFYWFFLSGRTFASSAAKLLQLLLLIIFGYSNLPTNIFGLKDKRLSRSCFEIPDVLVKDLVTTIAHMWNRGVHYINSLARGQDWKVFIKVAASLYLLKLMASRSLTVVIAIALVFAFTAFFIYEQYESEIDGLAKLTFYRTKEFVGLLTRNLPPSVASVWNYEFFHQDTKPTAVKYQK